MNGTDWQLLCVAFQEMEASTEKSKNIEMYAHQWLIILIFLGNWLGNNSRT